MYSFLRLPVIVFIFCGNLYAKYLGEVSLKKDEVKTIVVSLENIQKILSFRWTVYKNSVLVTHFKYDAIPYQFSLYRNTSNSAKITLDNIANTGSPDAYMMFYFVDYSDSLKEAKFRYYVFNFNGNIEVL